MKNEKFCFSKGTGLIALVGVLLVAFVLLSQLANQQTSTNSKASGDCTVSYNQVKYTVALNTCVKDTVTGYLTSFKCTSAGVVKDASCNPNAPATGCTHAYNGQKFEVPVDACLKDAPAVNGVNPPTNSFKCLKAGQPLVKDASCNPLAGVVTPDCTYNYNGSRFELAVGGCLKDMTAVSGTSAPPSNSYKCVKAGQALVKDASCDPNPATAATGCSYKYNGGTFALTVGQCLKDASGVDVNGNPVTPPSNSYKCVTAGQALVKDASCNPVAAATGCTYAYSGVKFELAVGDCLKSAAAVGGVNAPMNSYKCVTAGQPAVKDASCAPTCDEVGLAGFKCNGTVAYNARNTANTGTCKCQDPAATGVNPGIWGP